MGAKTYRVAIVGLGGIATRRPGQAADPVLGTRMPGSHAGGYARHARCRLVGYCDIAEAARDRFIERWGDVWPEARGYADAETMFGELSPDIVSVTTPDHLHADVLIAACEAGAAGIICEKPFATSLADADRMLAAAAASGTVVSVEHSRRWHPSWVEAWRRVREGDIGAVVGVRGYMGGERAMLFRNGTHLIDAIQFFAGAPPVRVSAWLQPRFRDYGPVYAGDGGRDPATDPGAVAHIEFANGVLGHYWALQTRVFRSLELDIVGEHGRLQLDDTEARIWEREHDPRSQPLRVPSATRSHLYAVVAEMVEVLDGAKPADALISPGVAGRHTVAIIAGILASNHRGGAPVDLDELPAR